MKFCFSNIVFLDMIKQYISYIIFFVSCCYVSEPQTWAEQALYLLPMWEFPYRVSNFLINSFVCFCLRKSAILLGGNAFTISVAFTIFWLFSKSKVILFPLYSNVFISFLLIIKFLTVSQYSQLTKVSEFRKNGIEKLSKNRLWNCIFPILLFRILDNNIRYACSTARPKSVKINRS